MVGQADPMAVGGAESSVTAALYESMRGTKPWVRFLAVLGFIGSGLMVLGGFFMLIGGGLMAVSDKQAMPFAGFPVVIALVYLVMGAIYLYPAVRLWAYGTRIGEMLASQSMHDLEAAIESQRRFWRVVGIYVIVLIGIYVLAIAGVVLVAIVGAVA